MQARVALWLRHADEDTEIEARVRGGVTPEAFQHLLTRFQKADCWSGTEQIDTTDHIYANGARRTGDTTILKSDRDFVDTEICGLFWRMSRQTERAAVSSGPVILARRKSRHRFVYNNTVAYDLTRVRVGKNPDKFEVELEYIGARPAVNPDRVAANFLGKVDQVAMLLGSHS